MILYIFRRSNFNNFNEALLYSETKENIIAITKDNEKSKYYPVKKGAKISEKIGFTSFTKPEVFIAETFGELNISFNYKELARDLGMEVAEQGFDVLKAYVILKLRKKGTKH